MDFSYMLDLLLIPLLFTLVQPAFIYTFLFCTATIIRHNSFGLVFSGCAAISIFGGISFICMLIDYILLPNVIVQKITVIMFIVVFFVVISYVIRQNLWKNELLVPFVTLFALTVVLIAWTYAPLGTADPLNTVVSRWVKWLPMDNQLPFFGAQALSSGAVAVGNTDPQMGEWLYSDRPPLQTALFMLTPGYLLPTPNAWAYNTAAISLQMLAVLGVWLLTMSLSQSRMVAMVASLTLFFTPITIEHGTFVWPKLLAASFTLCLAALLFGERRHDRATATQRGIVIGTLAVLAMLSHAGTAFAIMGIGIAALCTGRLTSWRENLVATITAIGLYSPWVYYQRIINPPGDRLLKWYLANVEVVDPRSIRQTLFDAYSHTTINQAISARFVNFRQIFSHYIATIVDTYYLIKSTILYDPAAIRDNLLSIREAEFYFVAAGTGLLGGMIVLLPVIAFYSAPLRPLALSIIITLALWVILMFQPGAATIHQGSYFVETAVIALSCIILYRFSRTLLLIIATIHGSMSLIQFVL